VAHELDLDFLRSGHLAAQLKDLGVRRVVPGGARRQDSVLAGLKALQEVDGALIHDAARPFVSRKLVRELALGLDDHHGVLPVVPVTSTVKSVDEQGFITRTVPRNNLRLAQTPQAGRLVDLLHAMEAADKDGVEFTDDVAALERAGLEVMTITDSSLNSKITTESDLSQAELLLAQILRKGKE